MAASQQHRIDNQPLSMLPFTGAHSICHHQAVAYPGNLVVFLRITKLLSLILLMISICHQPWSCLTRHHLHSHINMSSFNPHCCMLYTCCTHVACCTHVVHCTHVACCTHVVHMLHVVHNRDHEKQNEFFFKIPSQHDEIS